MPDLELLRRDVRAFADVAGRPLTEWQARAVALDTRTTVVVAPRQSGKSRTLAVLGLWWAFREAGQRVLIVSAGEEPARRLLADVRAIVVGSELLAASVVDERAALVTLSNGSEIRSVPASERQVRGWTTDLLLIDEAAMVADDLLLGAAIPTTAARPDARIVLASSATTSSGAFYDHAMRGEAGSDHVRTFRWALMDADWITPSTVAAARESMSPLRFAAEYEGVFASGADALFTRGALDRVTADYVLDELDAMGGPARVLAGVDWGAVNDRSALVAIGRLAGPERRFAVRAAKRWPAGYPLSGVVGEIAGSPAHFDTVAPETNGLGLPLAQDLAKALRRRAGVRGGAPAPRQVVVDLDEVLPPFGGVDRRRSAPLVVPGQQQPFRTRLLPTHSSADMKAAAYSALRLLIDRERLLLPASAEELRRELLMLRVDLTPSGGERIEAGSGHDDLADALMLACCPYRGADRRWHVYLAELADERRRLPEPPVDSVAFERMTRVRTPGGIDIPRTPLWVSPRGRELTTPAAASSVAPDVAYAEYRRAMELRVREANRP